MNERIKQLVEQAFIITTDGKIGHVNNNMVEKFAELIVQDCARHLREAHNGNFAVLADELKEYFGVE